MIRHHLAAVLVLPDSEPNEDSSPGSCTRQHQNFVLQSTASLSDTVLLLLSLSLSL